MEAGLICGRNSNRGKARPDEMSRKGQRQGGVIYDLSYSSGRWQELAEDVSGGVRVGTGWKELGEVGEVIASSDEGKFVNSFGTDLGEAGSGGEGIADALAAGGLFDGATFAEIIRERLGGTAVADRAILLAVEVAQVAEVANAAASVVIGGVGEGFFELGDFEGETGR